MSVIQPLIILPRGSHRARGEGNFAHEEGSRVRVGSVQAQLGVSSSSQSAEASPGSMQVRSSVVAEDDLLDESLDVGQVFL